MSGSVGGRGHGSAASRTAPFWPVAVVAGYDSIGYAVVGPVLPAIRDRAGATSLAASVIFAGFSIGLVAGFGLAGTVTKRLGPRTTLLLGIAAHLAADAMYASGHSAWTYTAARVLQGAGSGGMWLGAILAAMSWWPERPKLGGVLAAYAVGSVAGPLLSALGGTVRPFLADAALALGAFGAATRLPGGSSRDFGWRLPALRDRRLVFATSVVLLAALTYSSVEGSFTLRFSGRLSQAGLGALIATLALASGIGSLLPAAARGPRQGAAVARLGAVGAGAFLVAATAASTPVMWFLLLSLVGLTLGASEAGALGLLATMPDDGMLTAQVTCAQAWALGFLIGPPGATWLATSFGHVAPGIALLAAAIASAMLGGLIRGGDGRTR